MPELSFLARLVLTLLLLAASLFVYRWLQTTAPAPASLNPPPSALKRSKKKSAKKSAAADSPAPSPPPSQPSAPPTETAAAAAVANADNASDSDSDDGLSAAQVLATRKFKPKSLGGSRLARKIKASLPPADAPRFAVDQQVLARFGGGDQWFPATVLEQRKGNTYHLKYDDGEVEYRVPAEFIKLKPAKSEESEDSDADEEEKAVKTAESVGVQEELSDSDSSLSDDDDGWQVVGASSAAKRQSRRAQAAAPAEVLVDGLTKRQRESRRKKERQREKKEMLRQHAQKDDLDARARWRYVPS